MNLPEYLVTNATKKTLCHTSVDGKSYYVDPENETFYHPNIEKLSPDKSEIKLHLMTQPIGEQTAKFHEALAAVLTKIAAIQKSVEPVEPPAESSLPPVLEPAYATKDEPAAEPSIPPVLTRPSAAVTQPAPASSSVPAPVSIQDDTPTEPELPQDADEDTQLSQ